VFSVSGWSAMEWLTMTGWSVELMEGQGTLHGTATRDLYGEILEVGGEGPTSEDVAWVLIDRATSELERWEGRRALAA
jgi:hypothetical protein